MSSPSKTSIAMTALRDAMESPAKSPLQKEIADILIENAIERPTDVSGGLSVQAEILQRFVAVLQEEEAAKAMQLALATADFSDKGDLLTEKQENALAVCAVISEKCPSVADLAYPLAKRALEEPSNNEYTTFHALEIIERTAEHSPELIDEEALRAVVREATINGEPNYGTHFVAKRILDSHLLSSRPDLTPSALDEIEKLEASATTTHHPRKSALVKNCRALARSISGIHRFNMRGTTGFARRVALAQG